MLKGMQSITGRLPRSLTAQVCLGQSMHQGM